LDGIAGFVFPAELAGLEIDAVEESHDVTDEDGSVGDDGFGIAG
jgi:hypothetical protein